MQFHTMALKLFFVAARQAVPFSEISAFVWNRHYQDMNEEQQEDGWINGYFKIFCICVEETPQRV